MMQYTREPLSDSVMYLSSLVVLIKHAKTDLSTIIEMR
jgi:hypothetical protein